MDPIQQRIASLTPEQRARLEGRLLRAAAGAPPERIPRRDQAGPCPTSFGQQRLWFLEQLLPGGHLYNLPIALRLRGTLDVDALHRALETIVARHEALRTTFVEQDGIPLQHVAERLSVPLPVLDLSDRFGDQREAELWRHLDADIRGPFALDRGPLLRARLGRLGAEDHVLLLVLHHIVSDGWSTGVLLHELGALYAAFACGGPSPLTPLPIQYADYALWQRARLTGERLSTLLAYWRQVLVGAPTMLELPTDRPRPAIRTGAGRRHRLQIPGALTEELARLSRRERATLFMILLAAFQTMLSRYTGQTDVIVGTAIAGRPRTETEGLIGLFMGTLALRTDLSGDPTFRELLSRVRAVTQGAYAHQELPFERLVEDLSPERSLSHTPVFQTMFLLQNVPSTTLTLPGLAVTHLDADLGAARVDLTLSLRSATDGLRGAIDYDTDLFDPGTIARMAGHYETLLQGIVASPDQCVSSLPLLAAAERDRVLVQWNGTSADYPSDTCVHQLVEAQVERTPGAIAVVFGDQRLTYRELDARASRLAGRLQAEGVGPDTLVGICVERSLELIVGVLGILKAGGAYVPLDPEHPRDRLAFVMADAGARVVVAHKRLRDRLDAGVAPILELDSMSDAPEPTRVFGGGTVKPDHLAYVMYTSGSTGRPKGVAVAHRSVVNVLHAMSREPGLTARDVVLAVTTLSFDIATLELLLPLMVGARVVIASRDVASDGAQLAAGLAAAGVTVMQATPATWRLLIGAGWKGSPALRILCGGEALSAELARDLLARGASLWNLYGPTEATIWCTAHRVGAGDDPVPIGRPIANTRILILDPAGQPVPIGVSGEIHIGGVGLARGYLHRPELTAERFVRDPLSPAADARLFRTGDRARYRPDGTIEFLGRLDDQIKLRGFRIEPGEIEAALMAHPAVGTAAVVLKVTSPVDSRLLAYVVPRGAERPGAVVLREFLRGRLPDYMVPAAFVLLDRLPRTANGKLDRAALPDPEDADRTDLLAYVGPRTPMEAFLASTWRELLGVQEISMRDNFFDLGGHSLLAMRVIARVENQTGRRLSPGDLIFQTLEQVARQCEEKPTTAVGAAWPGVMARVRAVLRRAFTR